MSISAEDRLERHGGRVTDPGPDSKAACDFIGDCVDCGGCAGRSNVYRQCVGLSGFRRRRLFHHMGPHPQGRFRRTHRRQQIRFRPITAHICSLDLAGHAAGYGRARFAARDR
jgi:hypothetical protein